jgi:hypothetical protein
MTTTASTILLYVLGGLGVHLGVTLFVCWYVVKEVVPKGEARWPYMVAFVAWYAIAAELMRLLTINLEG